MEWWYGCWEDQCGTNLPEGICYEKCTPDLLEAQFSKLRSIWYIKLGVIWFCLKPRNFHPRNFHFFGQFCIRRFYPLHSPVKRLEFKSAEFSCATFNAFSMCSSQGIGSVLVGGHWPRVIRVWPFIWPKTVDFSPGFKSEIKMLWQMVK